MSLLNQLNDLISLQLPVGIIIGAILTNLVWIITSGGKNE